MSKRILLIDSDEAFAQGLSNAMKARGFEPTLATNSEQGMTLAKQGSPDLIVVCVEAQPTNGYMLCTRLKKDDHLKAIPIILTSANATPDAFEKHKKLKTRAEDYLIKPFAPQVVIEKAAALLGVPVPEAGGGAADDEALGLGDLVEGEDEPIHLSEADAAAARSGSDEPMLVEEVEEVVHVEETHAADEDDLQMFDRAFDQLGGAAAGGEGTPVAQHGDDEVSQPTEMSVPDDDSVLSGLLDGPAAHPPAPPGRSRKPRDEEALDPAGPRAEDELALDQALSHTPGNPAHDQGAHATDEGAHALETRLAELEAALAERDAELAQARKGASSAGELAKARAEKTRAEKESNRLKEQLEARDRELAELHEQQATLEAQIAELRDDASKREASAKALQQRADALAAAAKKFERELGAARDDAKAAGALKARLAELEQFESEHAELQRKHEAVSSELLQLHSDSETSRHELEGVRAELETVRAEMTALTGEKELLAEEREDLRRQLEEARSSAQQNEERAIKAYGKLKGDEKLREKTRQALQIALQLLEDHAADADDATTN